MFHFRQWGVHSHIMLQATAKPLMCNSCSGYVCMSGLMSHDYFLNLVHWEARRSITWSVFLQLCVTCWVLIVKNGITCDEWYCIFFLEVVSVLCTAEDTSCSLLKKRKEKCLSLLRNLSSIGHPSPMRHQQLSWPTWEV